jgi:2-polyprenyl-3-methyl-5-hydroxy-6-metoxy-1,4-benzoquinol methylase
MTLHSFIEGSMHMKLPLTFEEIVNEIVSFTDFSRDEVAYRVQMETLEIGWNVRQDVARFGVTPHQYDEKMIQLYREGDGFIFETFVFWLRPNRYRWTQHALERAHLYATRSHRDPSDIRILMFGDGIGNDSLYLADNGYAVDYYDVPGSKTYDFAMKRFASYGLLGRYINPLNDYQACFTRQYDVVVSFEVLEHLPEPLQTIKDISSMLKTGGIALITEDFGDIVDYLPTHLDVSSKFQGKTPFLFLENRMVLSWYSRDELFKPCEFVRVKRVSAKDVLSLLRDDNVRRGYLYNNSSQALIH